MNIKPELLAEYESYAEKNSKDEYSKACITAGEAVMKALDEGKTYGEAKEAMYGRGLTGFMAGVVASAVSGFHERGEEFRKEWNKEYDIESGKGTVNPAIVTIKDK